MNNIIKVESLVINAWQAPYNIVRELSAMVFSAGVLLFITIFDNNSIYIVIPLVTVPPLSYYLAVELRKVLGNLKDCILVSVV